MHDEVDAMDGRRFLAVEGGTVNLWGKLSLGVSSNCLVLVANVPHSVAKIGW